MTSQGGPPEAPAAAASLKSTDELGLGVAVAAATSSEGDGEALGFRVGVGNGLDDELALCAGPTDALAAADADGPTLGRDVAALGLGTPAVGQLTVTLAPAVVTVRAFPYVASRPSIIDASSGPIGMPSATVPQPVALKLTIRNSWSPAGTESGGKNAAATLASLPFAFAFAMVAPKSGGRNTGESAYGAPRVTEVTCSFVRSNTIVADAPLVAASAFVMTFTVNEASLLTVAVAGTRRRE
jgi:hypothetical protein